ncbi:MAG TPA: hypothetical protein VMU17_05940 [Elusimicrobiota bacterium]|nr:hypothetical protein [Elusimicrobiota bacterium]
MAELPSLAAWENFYVILGSSAAALIGLQFVVITLIAETRARASIHSIRAFGTSTIVNFSGALLLSAVMSMPWPSLHAVSVALALCAAAHLGYGVVGLHGARRQTEYKPTWDDWLWFVIAPAALHVVVLVAAFQLPGSAIAPLFWIAAAALGLLFVGIRNAWDTVTYLIVTARHGQNDKAG